MEEGVRQPDTPRALAPHVVALVGELDASLGMGDGLFDITEGEVQLTQIPGGVCGITPLLATQAATFNEASIGCKSFPRASHRAQIEAQPR